MNRQFSAFAALCMAMSVLLVAQPAAGQGSGEWVAQARLPDLVVAFEHRDRGSTIVERIPPGESVQAWSVMATNQRFARLLANGATIDDWLGNFLGSLDRGCPGYRSSDLLRTEQSGRPMVELRLDCPRNPSTGLPETFFLRAIAGRTDLHVAQVAFRRVPSAADVSYAQRHLATVRYCDRTDRTAACRNAATSPEAR